MTYTTDQIAATAATIDNALESGRPLLERAAALFLAAELERCHFSPVDTASELGVPIEQLRAWIRTEQVQRVIGSNVVDVGVNPLQHNAVVTDAKEPQ